MFIEDNKMCNSYIVSLITNIPIKQSLNIIKKRLMDDKDLKKSTKLSVEGIVELLEFILTITYFEFRGGIYYLHYFWPKMYCYKSIVRLPDCESIDSPLKLWFSYYNNIDLTPKLLIYLIDQLNFFQRNIRQDIVTHQMTILITGSCFSCFVLV